MIVYDKAFCISKEWKVMLKPHKENKLSNPTERSVKINTELQNIGDRIHKMDISDYERGIIRLISKEEEALHEAILNAENYLSYNGSWDFERNIYKEQDLYICDLRYKWNGYASIAEKIRHLSLPSDVDVIFLKAED